jgi:hypothetical protein
MVWRNVDGDDVLFNAGEGREKHPSRRLGEKRLIVRISVYRLGGFGPEMQPWS